LSALKLCTRWLLGVHKGLEDLVKLLESLSPVTRKEVTPVVGIHPKKTIDETSLSKLQSLLELPEVVGLGEIGLDRKVPAITWAEQMLKLEAVLNFLNKEHILVLHSRSLTELGDKAIHTLLLLLKCHQSVIKEQLIHFHCFTGSLSMLKKWLEVFPNTYIGFTVLSCRSMDHKETVMGVESSRLLLESDAPYFSPPKCDNSTPSMIGWVASRLAKARGTTWEKLIELASFNTRRRYIEKKLPLSGNSSD
jgi:TatD DNase family protein